MIQSASKQYGQYRVIREIGRGGYGTVFLAENSLFPNHLFAIKVFERKGDGTDFAGPIRDELNNLIGLIHPNIVQVRGFGLELSSESPEPYIVMDFIKGPGGDSYNLKRHLQTKGGKLPLADTLTIFKQILSALSLVHDKRVAHLDLKPQNILLDTNLNAYVSDFGISQVVSSMSVMEGTMVAIQGLTPTYASPEQISTAAGSRHSDVFSLGVMLLECLTGTRPEFVQSRVQPRVDYAKPSEYGLDKRLDTLLGYCLAVDPADRYPNAKHLAAALNAFEAGRPIPAPGDPIVEKTAPRTNDPADEIKDDITSPATVSQDTFTRMNTGSGKRKQITAGLVIGALFTLTALAGGMYLGFWGSGNERGNEERKEGKQAVMNADPVPPTPVPPSAPPQASEPEVVPPANENQPMVPIIPPEPVQVADPTATHSPEPPPVVVIAPTMTTVPPTATEVIVVIPPTATVPQVVQPTHTAEPTVTSTVPSTPTETATVPPTLTATMTPTLTATGTATETPQPTLTPTQSGEMAAAEKLREEANQAQDRADAVGASRLAAGEYQVGVEAYKRAMGFMEQARYDRAIESFKEAVAGFDRSFQVSDVIRAEEEAKAATLGQIMEARELAAQGKFKDAEKLYKEYLTRYPQDGPVTLEYADLVFHNISEAQGMSLYNKAIKMPGISPSQRGQIYAIKAERARKYNNLPQAIQEARNGLAVDPTNGALQNMVRQYEWELAELRRRQAEQQRLMMEGAAIILDKALNK